MAGLTGTAILSALRDAAEKLTRPVKRQREEVSYAGQAGAQGGTTVTGVTWSGAFGVAAGLVLLAGCSEGMSEKNDLIDAGGHGEHLPNMDGSVSTPDAEPSGAAPGRDRCFAEACDAPVLPAQFEVPFLEPAADGWQRLIQAEWQLGARSEGYRCVRKTVPQDVYIVAFSPLNPRGTHHTTLEVNTRTGNPDGVSWCAGPSAGGDRRLQGSGVGTAALDLPQGVAMKLAAGEQLSMNLHLFNVGDTALGGTSGMWVKTIPADAAAQLAEVVLAGPLGLSIPEGRSIQSGRCTFQKPAKIYSLGPHMHQLGAHMRVTAHSSIAGERVIHDLPYDFTHQLLYPVEQIEMAAGDWLSIECTYENTAGRTVFWGDSSLDEMCFVGVGRFPAAGGTLCVN